MDALRQSRRGRDGRILAALLGSTLLLDPRVTKRRLVFELYTGGIERPAAQPALDAALAEVGAGTSRIKPNAESRMIPSVTPKEHPIPFRP